MKCSKCGKDLRPGRLVATSGALRGVAVVWTSPDGTQVKPLKDGKKLLGDVVLDGVWYCSSCNTATGTFRVEQKNEMETEIRLKEAENNRPLDGGISGNGFR